MHYAPRENPIIPSWIKGAYSYHIDICEECPEDILVQYEHKTTPHWAIWAKYTPGSTVKATESYSKEVIEISKYIHSKTFGVNFGGGVKVQEDDWEKNSWLKASQELLNKHGKDLVIKNMDWAANDSFWFKNARSPAGLKRNWDKISMQADSDSSNKNKKSKYIASKKDRFT